MGWVVKTKNFTFVVTQETTQYNYAGCKYIVFQALHFGFYHICTIFVLNRISQEQAKENF